MIISKPTGASGRGAEGETVLKVSGLLSEGDMRGDRGDDSEGKRSMPEVRAFRRLRGQLNGQDGSKEYIWIRRSQNTWDIQFYSEKNQMLISVHTHDAKTYADILRTAQMWQDINALQPLDPAF